MTKSLYEISTDLREFQKLIIQEGLSETDLHDQLNSMKMDFDKKIVDVITVIQNLGEPLMAIDHEIARLNQRKQHIKNESSKLKKYVVESMKSTERKRIVSDLFTITLAKGVEKVVADVDDLSDEYINVKTEITADKKKIKEDLKNGIEIFGARLERGEESLRIK